MTHKTFDTDVLVIGAGGGIRAGERPISMMMARRKGEFIINSGHTQVSGVSTNQSLRPRRPASNVIQGKTENVPYPFLCHKKFSVSHNSAEKFASSVTVIVQGLEKSQAEAAEQ
jgi:hypothetical protein